MPVAISKRESKQVSKRGSKRGSKQNGPKRPRNKNGAPACGQGGRGGSKAGADRRKPGKADPRAARAGKLADGIDLPHGVHNSVRPSGGKNDAAANIALMILGAFVFFCLFAGDAAGFAGALIKSALRGLFGISGYIAPLFICAVCVYRLLGGRAWNRGKLYLFCAFAAGLSGLAHLIDNAPIQSAGLFDYIRAVFDSGSAANGGVLGAGVGNALRGVFGDGGSVFALIACMAILLCFIFQSGIAALFFRLREYAQELSERGAARGAGYYDEDYYEEDYDDYYEEDYEDDDYKGGRGGRANGAGRDPRERQKAGKAVKPYRKATVDIDAGVREPREPVLLVHEEIEPPPGRKISILRQHDNSHVTSALTIDSAGRDKAPPDTLKAPFEYGAQNEQDAQIPPDDAPDYEGITIRGFEEERRPGDVPQDGAGANGRPPASEESADRNAAEEAEEEEEEEDTAEEAPRGRYAADPDFDIDEPDDGASGSEPGDDWAEALSMRFPPKKAAEPCSPFGRALAVNDSHIFPPLELLNPRPPEFSSSASKAQIYENSRKLEDTLKSFGVEAKVVAVSRGPTITRYELSPGQGVKVSRISSLADDLALNLAAVGIRIEAPIPGKAAVGIEIPNKEVTPVFLREVLEDKQFINYPSKLAFGLGKDIAGNVVVADIAKMPHLLIAGATGSGKSVCVNTMITSLIYKANPDEVKLLMVDPKVVELGVYNGIPHLLIPVVTDPKKAASALNWAVEEMLTRYKLFAQTSVRDLKGYNEALKSRGDDKFLPQLVIIIDELADLMMAAPGDVEDSICRLAQMARAAGIYLIIATQRPSVDVITGLIKANVPSRLAFMVSSGTDSRTILDMNGAEKLLGKGDMLFYPVSMSKPMRIQGAFISDKEVEAIVSFVKRQGERQYDPGMIERITSGGGPQDLSGERDELFIPAAEFLIKREKASASILQRQFKIGYNRASRLIEQLEARGVVGPEDGAKPRKVLLTHGQWAHMLEQLEDK